MAVGVVRGEDMWRPVGSDARILLHSHFVMSQEKKFLSWGGTS